jgi:hypothetical protein
VLTAYSSGLSGLIRLLRVVPRPRGSDLRLCGEQFRSVNKTATISTDFCVTGLKKVS